MLVFTLVLVALGIGSAAFIEWCTYKGHFFGVWSWLVPSVALGGGACCVLGLGICTYHILVLL